MTVSERRIYVLVIMEVNEALFFLFLEALRKEIKKFPCFYQVQEMLVEV